MSWHTMIIGGAAVAVVALFVYKHLTSGLTDPERAEIQKALAAGAKLIDVRTPQEYATAHVDGAINVPLRELPNRLKRLGSRRKPLVIYCHSGSRSAQAARYLRERGFQRVLDMKRMSNWSAVVAGRGSEQAASDS